MELQKRCRVVSPVSSARHSGTQVRQLQPRFRVLSCGGVHEEREIDFRERLRGALTDLRLSNPSGREVRLLFLADRVCKNWSLPMAPGRNSRPLLSRDKLLVWERRAFNIVPSTLIGCCLLLTTCCFHGNDASRESRKYLAPPTFCSLSSSQMATLYLLLLLVVLASVAGPARAGQQLLAKPARIPFTQERGEILLHVGPDLRKLCRGRSGPPVTIHAGEWRLESWARLEETADLHTDRFGLQWSRVSVDLSRFPLGATSVNVSACGDWVTTKARTETLKTYTCIQPLFTLSHTCIKLQVVKAKWRDRSTYTVDNVHGRLLDSNGFPFIAFGSYIYGVTTAIERAVPETEIPFGVQQERMK